MNEIYRRALYLLVTGEGRDNEPYRIRQIIDWIFDRIGK